MKYLDEYRDPTVAVGYIRAISNLVTRPRMIMEVCGGQTHAIMKHGLDRLMPSGVTLLHGPGCPVCVTPVELINAAIALAGQDDVIFCTFGDMMRVPGSKRDLFMVKAAGGDVRTVYSPTDALRTAIANPERQVVFFAIGFETTAPANAATVHQARQRALDNFSILSAQVLIPPAMEFLLSAKDCKVDGFLAAGHVCTVTGYTEYEALAERYNIPIVVTGFEPLDILRGIHMVLEQLESGRSEVSNAYPRAVQREGNVSARRLIDKVFRVTDRAWRGFGIIPDSGLELSEEYADFDARRRFALEVTPVAESGRCISGLILRGNKTPRDCPAFGMDCTPDHPLGATMVSSEGACAAYYRYGPEAPTTTNEPRGKT